jgi:hypothetical protein
MPDEQDLSIIKTYPDLFDLDSCPTGSAMHLGLQLNGSGWLGLLDRLCANLQPLTQMVSSEGEEFKILAVKQKLGTLRVAYRGASDAIEAEIERAKAEALRTCETCGGAGTLRSLDGYLTILCDQCNSVLSGPQPVVGDH